MKEVFVLIEAGVIPVIVFDGNYLPQKANVEKERAEKRKINLDQAKKYVAQRRDGEAFQYFSKAVDVTPVNISKAIRITN